MSAQKLITRRGEYDTMICAYAQGHIEHAKHTLSHTDARTHTHTHTRTHTYNTLSTHTHTHTHMYNTLSTHTFARRYQREMYVHIRMCMHMFNTL